MNLDEAYGIITFPLRILQNVEKAIQPVGVALPAWMSQTILFLAAVILAYAAWRWFIKLKEWNAKRIVVLFIALAITMVAVPIPVFWLQFKLKPPTGVVLGEIKGFNDGGWELVLFDTRNQEMKREDIIGVQGNFGLNYKPGFGQVPSHVLVNHRKCTSSFIIKLTKGEVFATDRMKLELRCKP